jgi:hypothetical protein
MPANPTITLKQLDEKNACLRQRDMFEKLFGESVELSEEVVEKHAHNFDINWCAQNLLSSELYVEFIEQRGPAFVEFDRLLDEESELGKKYTSLLRDFKKKLALIFYRLYKEQI